MSMKNDNELAQFLDNHEYPKLFYQFPILVRCVYVLNYILTLRNWYVRRMLKRVEKNISPTFSFLDAGCGMGEFAIGVAQRNPNAHVVGVDYTASNIPLANRVVQEMQLTNILFSIGDITTMQVKNGYDFILCNSTLQFIKQDVKALKNLYMMLAYQGKMILYVPISYRRYLRYTEFIESNYLSDFFYKYHDDFLMHRYQEADITKKIQQAGFHIIRKEYSYGICGAIAFELYSHLLAVVKKTPIILSLPLTLIYTIGIFPLQFILMLADFILPKSVGNGILYVVEKP